MKKSFYQNNKRLREFLENGNQVIRPKEKGKKTWPGMLNRSTSDFLETLRPESTCIQVRVGQGANGRIFMKKAASLFLM